ncbi:MAG: ribonuclease E/G [Robiginitomaculum sp.]|nr:ribonuclease E/G [Robiginitomaculum sp.]
MTETVLVDEAIGETRACLFDDQGQAVELLIERWSERVTRVTEGSQHQGKVVKVDAGLNAAFVELPMGEAGFLPFGKKGRPASIHEGAKILVQVSREALPGKGPNLMLLPDDAQISAAPSLVQRMYLPGGVEVETADRAGREQIDASIDQALGKLVTIPGGGNIAIEQTRALVAIDVDTANSPQTGGKFNYKAAQTAFRHLRLRSLGGIVVIDFAPMRTKNERAALAAALNAMAKHDPARVDLLPMSRFGTVELLRRRTMRSPSEILLGRNGKKTLETIALESLRGLENEALANTSKQLKLRAGAAIFAWLEEDNIGWQEELVNRIGSRFKLVREDNFSRQQWEAVAL